MKNAFIIPIIFLFGCIGKENDLSISFNRSMFKIDTSLVAESMNFTTSLWPASFTVINDTLIFVRCRKPDPAYIEIYNLKTGSFFLSFAISGKGPNEFLGCRLIYRTSLNKYFILHDKMKSTVSIYDIDSVINKGILYSPQKFKIPEFVDDVIDYDPNNFIGFNDLYLNDTEFDNKVKNIILINKFKHKDFYKDQENFKYFTPNVSGGLISMSPESDKIWVANKHDNRIDILDKNLNLIKKLIGPENFKPQFVLKQTEWTKQISFKGTYECYADCFGTKSGIYLIYIGTNNSSNNFKSFDKPVDVLKFSWNGDLLTRYRLDRFIYNISIDKNEKYLYGSSVKKSFDEYPQLVRYRLK